MIKQDSNTGEARVINDWIKTNLGLNPYQGPFYRLVWSDSEIEKRRGIYRDYLGDIFLREVHETRQTPKYSYLKERWVLEMWIPPEFCDNPELPDSRKGLYEPLYVFHDNQGNYLPPNLKVVKFIIEAGRKVQKETPQQKIARLLDLEIKEVQEIEDALEVSPITNALHMKDAVGYSKGIKDVS